MQKRQRHRRTVGLQKLSPGKMRPVQHDIKYTAEKLTFALQLDLCKRIVCRRSGDPFYST
jgi:hypothetical protein